MLLKDIAKLGKLFGHFLDRFSDCFSRIEGRHLLLVYVRGLLSSVQRSHAVRLVARGLETWESTPAKLSPSQFHDTMLSFPTDLVGAVQLAYRSHLATSQTPCRL